MITAKVKDRPGLLDDAERLRRAGRNGDHLIAHITPEEAALLKARGGSGTVNPKTGLLEFFEGSTAADSHGSNSDGYSGGGYGGGSAYGGGGAGEGVASDTYGGLADLLGGAQSNPSQAPGGKDEGDRARDASRAGGIGAFNDSRSAFDRISDYFSTKVNDAKANPIATALNAVVSFTPLGLPNTVSGLFGGRTIGDLTTAAARGLTNYQEPGAPAPSTPADPGTPDGFASDSRGGAGEQGQAPFQRNGMFGGETTTDQIVRDAIRRAVIYKPGAYNSWQGNRFVIPDIKW